MHTSRGRLDGWVHSCFHSDHTHGSQPLDTYDLVASSPDACAGYIFRDRFAYERLAKLCLSLSPLQHGRGADRRGPGVPPERSRRRHCTCCASGTAKRKELPITICLHHKTCLSLTESRANCLSRVMMQTHQVRPYVQRMPQRCSWCLIHDVYGEQQQTHLFRGSYVKSTRGQGS